MAYARIENGIVRIYFTLPQSYTFPDGSYTGNFADMPAAMHKKQGFLPFEDSPPAYNSQTSTLQQDGYEVTKKRIRQKYKITPIPEEVIASRQAEEESVAWQQVKEKCKQLLAETDRKWDAPNREEYVTYRQALRDILNSGNINPTAVLWPEKPE